MYSAHFQAVLPRNGKLIGPIEASGQRFRIGGRPPLESNGRRLPRQGACCRSPIYLVPENRFSTLGDMLVVGRPAMAGGLKTALDDEELAGTATRKDRQRPANIVHETL